MPINRRPGVLLPGALERLDRIGNALWKEWHWHLYTCDQCRTGVKCADGERLYGEAAQQKSIDRI